MLKVKINPYWKRKLWINRYTLYFSVNLTAHFLEWAYYTIKWLLR